MKLLIPLSLIATSRAQEFGSAISLSNDNSVSASNDWTWSESGNGKAVSADDSVEVTAAELEDTNQDILNEFEKAQEDDDINEYIAEFKKKFGGIYNPNMYPYGPMHGDFRAPPADDAVSETIDLPSPFPMFNGQSTNKIRASTNGMIILDNKQVFEQNPTALPSIEIDTPFVAGFWADLWSKKHGRIYWRLEQLNETLLAGMRDDIIDGFPEMEYMGRIKYAFIMSYWRVTHYGAKKANGMEQNTFQMAIATDGQYSFLINNYMEINWNLAIGQTNKAVAGFDIDNTYYTMQEGSLTDDSFQWNTASTNSNLPGRHIFRLDEMQSPVTPGPITTGPSGPKGEVTAQQIWPANDNTLGGGIFNYIPEFPIGNGTCTIQFPNNVAWFHVFDAHIRADTVVSSMSWKIVAANKAFEPNSEDGSFTFAINFYRGFEFTEADVSMTCDETDEFTYAVYSFPQNNLQQNGRSNLRRKNNDWDPAATYSVSFANVVGNFTVDDPRIQVNTVDNQNFLLSEVPDTIEEIWFQFEYLNYFGSNEVGVLGDQDSV